MWFYIINTLLFVYINSRVNKNLKTISNLVHVHVQAVSMFDVLASSYICHDHMLFIIL